MKLPSLKGVLAYNPTPSSWRVGIETVVQGDGAAWRWLVLGPIAVNLGAV